MKYVFGISLWVMFIIYLLVFGVLANAQVVQIADVRTNGMWSNWKNQTVTWVTMTVPSLPKDSFAVDYNNKQEWFIPIADGTYKKFTFPRSKLGEYAIRIGYEFPDGTLYWSMPVPCLRATK